MTIELYKIIYNRFAYQDINMNNPILSIANFDTSKYKTYDDKYKDIRKIMCAQWLKDIFGDRVINDLHKCNKIYFALNRLYYIIAEKRAKTYDCTYDLTGTPLDSLSNRCKIYLLEGNTRYVFRISDIIKVINDSLTYNEYGHIMPRAIKNPYTNTPFNYSNLYHIYFQIKSSNYIMPTLLHYYFLSNFDCNDLLTEFNYEMQEWNTSHLDQHYTRETMVKRIHNMLKDMRDIFKYIHISDGFPDVILIEAFQPFLYMYVTILSTRNVHKFRRNNEILVKKAIEFNRMNRYFGRKIITNEKQYVYNEKTQVYVERSKRILKHQTEFVPYSKLDIAHLKYLDITRYESMFRNSVSLYEEDDEASFYSSDDEFPEVAVVNPESLNDIDYDATTNTTHNTTNEVTTTVVSTATNTNSE